MTRPILGNVTIGLPIEMIHQIDTLRGVASRSEWIREACKVAALRPTEERNLVLGPEYDEHLVEVEDGQYITVDELRKRGLRLSDYCRKVDALKDSE